MLFTADHTLAMVGYVTAHKFSAPLHTTIWHDIEQPNIRGGQAKISGNFLWVIHAPRPHRAKCDLSTCAYTVRPRNADARRVCDANVLVLTRSKIATFFPFRFTAWRSCYKHTNADSRLGQLRCPGRTEGGDRRIK